jgi:hypothetical protein
MIALETVLCPVDFSPVTSRQVERRPGHSARSALTGSMRLAWRAGT